MPDNPRWSRIEEEKESTLKRANCQLLEETTYPNLAALSRSGGRLEVGVDHSDYALARICMGNQTVIADTAYRDFAAVLKKMDAKARSFLSREYERRSLESK